MSDTLRDQIADIVERIWLGDDEYWQDEGISATLDREAVINDIMKAIVESDDVPLIYGVGDETEENRKRPPPPYQWGPWGLC